MERRAQKNPRDTKVYLKESVYEKMLNQRPDLVKRRKAQQKYSNKNGLTGAERLAKKRLKEYQVEISV